jgi:hypothetical protein
MIHASGFENASRITTHELFDRLKNVVVRHGGSLIEALKSSNCPVHSAALSENSANPSLAHHYAELSPK